MIVCTVSTHCGGCIGGNARSCEFAGATASFSKQLSVGFVARQSDVKYP